MPTARETLLDAAHTAVRAQPWTGVRMVDVAAAAGVSRQTLYNEFGSKEGLGAALVSRLVEDFLDGAARTVAESCRRGADAAACCAAAAAWMLRTAREEPIVHAALTGCWEARMPLPAPARHAPPGRLPSEPGQLAVVLRNRAVAGLGSAECEYRALERAYEAGLRVALSYVVAESGGPDDETCSRVDETVRALLQHAGRAVR
ncbi:TetR/AcrR family transcriptional regulator [Streptomyces boncukensis]|uniref:TetR/AcrR family transcriptional regulator n=1 Tax=Streptomyces boncukensis TaxID=2711219 RepID=A0A6G4WRW8_9ACTN|nr:TetR/AcrR family transcriptional regulator [Streptomyces boncukensis]NGO67380.1 TetR/AcrR family transcriptional regulator [Streptomyces boncukensis]